MTGYQVSTEIKSGEPTFVPCDEAMFLIREFDNLAKTCLDSRFDCRSNRRGADLPGYKPRSRLGPDYPSFEPHLPRCRKGLVSPQNGMAIHQMDGSCPGQSSLPFCRSLS